MLVLICGAVTFCHPFVALVVSGVAQLFSGRLTFLSFLVGLVFSEGGAF